MAFNSIILRLELDHKLVNFGDVASAVSDSGGDIISIDVIRPGSDISVRDITVQAADEKEKQIVDSLRNLQGITIVNVSDRTFLAHLGGKISIQPSMPIRNRDDLSRVYTPGVARVSMAIHENVDKAYSLTIKRNTVAVVSDGTAVLGLGDIGPHAAAPVMEGKAMLFKQLADVDAFPICLDTKDTEEIIQVIKAISPIFGGINLEDISSPRCFEIEARLAEELDIPVFHDDQHGTAIVVIAGLINALKVTGKRMEDIRVVVNGIGAAGVSICKMLLASGVKTLIPVDKDGIIVRGGKYPHPMWQWLSEQPQVEDKPGILKDAIVGADVFIGVSRGNVLDAADVEKMAPGRIVFAMANPQPEIEPEKALPLVSVFATGRSDYPNQINNVLVFPGVFRGALDCRAKVINEQIKLAAAHAIADVVSDSELNEQYIIPSIFNEKVAMSVRRAVIEAAIRTGVARRTPPDMRPQK
ncbi:NAD-dependent malic enzyme [Paenibacillus sp. J22TS3]|uniref:NAD-dependent malic enzyme n=1 Tax=Paenibacillus sp. J22TS3 TaxID=2807192 RepID=UPI001B165588|nr:NAD-dependent malic enzyme [Paenibacillus sp. J22TS3]GIP23857.1 malate dehydrogenase [Paenibacillus sp. J22TS3]